EEFKPGYVSRLISLGRRYLVSQTYYRVRELEQDASQRRVNLLFSDYMELGEAKLHLNAVKKDRYAAIIDLENPLHLAKIQEMLLPDSGYRMFFAVVRSAKELENLVNRKYKDKLRHYVEKQTDWRISRDAIVKPMIQLSFGELFVILKHKNQHIRIKFEEIEKQD
ncbi:MAG TPA: hypothetical protein VHQ04_12795, partial [Puia sp.]|nr:hypothetical protein [Puia sp.]